MDNVDNLDKIDDTNKYQFTSISIYSIFILFLIISSNYLGELFPCRIQKLLSENIYLKHIFGYLTLSFFVVLVDPYKKINITTVFRESIILYTLFLFLINTQQYFFIFSIFLLFLIYIVYLKKIEYEENINIKSNSIDNDKDKEKEKQIELKKQTNNDNNYEYKLYILNKINYFLYILFIIVIIIGFLIYMGEKKIEYKDKFSYIKFIFGLPKCRNKSPDVDFIKSIQYIFN